VETRSKRLPVPTGNVAEEKGAIQAGRSDQMNRFHFSKFVPKHSLILVILKKTSTKKNT
jgi:hypothetical protein